MICASPWHGLYSGQTALLTPDSFAHPAKMAPALVFRIFDHLAELGLLKPDDTVLDPMAGTGLTGLAWAAKGGRSVLVELEPRFVGFIGENKAQLARTLGREVDIEVLQGDARHLSELLGERGLKAVTSPPYGDAVNSGKPGIDYAKAGRLDRLQESESRHNPMSTGEWAYGTTPGQIGALPDKPLKAVTSPPYGHNAENGGLNTLPPRNEHDQAGRSPDSPSQAGGKAGYSDDPSNIGNLPDTPLKAVTSPPYIGHKGQPGYDDSDIRASRGLQVEYGHTEGQIADTPESYLSAMRAVYSEVAQVADVLVVVTKNPTRNGQLRRLDLDTIALLEETGWAIHCHHHAILFEETEQADLFGGSKKQTKGRLSFFKRLSWQKGNAVARWEDVLVCARGSQ